MRLFPPVTKMDKIAAAAVRAAHEQPYPDIVKEGLCKI
jgi:hypothetical protein